jgi:hypothetical protein
LKDDAGHQGEAAVGDQHRTLNGKQKAFHLGDGGGGWIR